MKWRNYIPRSSEELLVTASNISLLYESVLGIMQITRLSHVRNGLFTLTGTFPNPGPYGGFVAMTMAIACAFLVQHRDRIRGLAGLTSMAAFLSGVLVLPASMSRTAWLALAASVCVLLGKRPRVRQWVRFRKAGTITFVVLLLLALVGIFFLKKESAVGRLHIWHMECLAIGDAPVRGHGTGMELGAYGKAQEAYFRTGDRPLSDVLAAGSPEYAFNEYLSAALQWGIPALLAIFLGIGLVFWGLERKRSCLLYGMIVFSVFAAASYPMTFPLFRAALLLFVCEALPVRSGGIVGLALALTLNLAPLAKKDYRTLYQRAYALFQQGAFEAAIPLLEEGTDISADPMFLVIQGRCHEGLGQPGQAETCYRRASWRVPGRLYPRLLMARLKVRNGQPEEALQTLDEALSLPVNARNRNMVRLHEDCRHLADSLRLNPIP